jgi:hypothetical protein
VSNWRHDRRLYDKATTRRSVSEVPRPNHGSGPCTGSRARKDQAEKRRVGYTHKVKANKVKPTKSKRTRKSLVPPGARYHRSVLGAVAKRTKDGHKKTGRA